MSLTASELILTPDGAIYHLNLRPEQLAPTIFLVGDPERVVKVSQHFTKIDHQVRKREFHTHTGWLDGKHVSVVSTGIGPDNIDIVLNELDALVNIDFQTRTVRDSLTSLNLIRLGTAGSLSADIAVDSFVISAFGVGLDNLMQFYGFQGNEREVALRDSFGNFAQRLGLALPVTAAASDTKLLEQMGKEMHTGITLTCPGFYAPQGRSLRLESILGRNFFEQVGSFKFEELQLANFEMETAAILGLSRMLGHRAVSCSAILANRQTGEFSPNPKVLEARLIEQALLNFVGWS